MDNLAAETGGQTRQRYTIFKTSSTVQSSTPLLILTSHWRKWAYYLCGDNNIVSMIGEISITILLFLFHSNPLPSYKIPSSGTNVIFLYISVQQNLFVHLLRLFQFIDMWVALPFIDKFVLLAKLIYWICLLPFGPYVFVSLMSFSFC